MHYLIHWNPMVIDRRRFAEDAFAQHPGGG